jgi:oligopeptidase B
MVPGHDGVEIPMNLFFKKGFLKLDRRNRTLLEGYGAYGLSLSKGFSIGNLTAMDKGYVIAQAAVRGGGERGIGWHQEGKLSKKMNSFRDFTSCAEYLIANRITHPNILCAKGTSAGGTLVANACLNMRPDLFRAVILEVPFLDVLGSLLDEELPLTKTDHLEFGNPIFDDASYKQIASYSPYENLTNREYPAVLMTI